MDKFEIIGKKRLSGKIEVRGSKNATTPILAATILTKEECIVSNVPLIEDVFRMLEILQSMGSNIEWIGKRKIKITNNKIDIKNINQELVKKIRSSILLLGSLSSRFEKFNLSHPGGCSIGARPVGTHFEALKKMGVNIKQDGKNYIVDASKRKNAKVVLNEFSVTATENVMMLAAGIPQKTIIKIAASEPHVEDLGNFLIKMGVKIKGLGTHTLEITGTKKLKGVKHEVIPDFNEAATFLIMGVATKSQISIIGAKENHLDLVLELLKRYGAEFKISKNSITVIPSKKVKSINRIDTRPYPGIPTDIQASLGVLATQADGETLIFDTMFENRFNYLGELEKMRAESKILNSHQAIIYGPRKLKGNKILSFDLRAGAALIIAALLAEGKTIIQDIYQVDRGYEKIEERLQKLGANIKRIKN